MLTIEEVTNTITTRFRNIGIAQASGCNSFNYIRETDNTILIKSENGVDARVPKDMIRKAVEAVRTEPHIYHSGPSGLRNYGITHVTSPVWAMLHLVTFEEILGAQ